MHDALIRVTQSVGMSDIADQKRVGRRLRALMAHLNMGSVQELADALGSERSRVSNWLNGYNMPPVPQMAKLLKERASSVTLDWLYLGNADAVPHALAIRLTALEDLVPVPEVQPEPESACGPQGQAAPPARRRRVRQAT